MGENSYRRALLSAEAALRMAQAAVAKAGELDTAVCVAVVDVAGMPKAVITMDGAVPVAVEGARRKANTALMGMASAVLADTLNGQPARAASFAHFESVGLLGGGMPVLVGGELVGGIGVGGSTEEHDIVCAQAGLAEL